MGRKKKIDKQMQDCPGIRVVWIAEHGEVKEDKFYAISDNYRLLKAYYNICHHIERHIREIEEGEKYRAWKELHNKK